MRHPAFPGRGPEVSAQYQRAGQWILATLFENDAALKWCRANGVVITRASQTGTNSAGGFLVPTELADAILDIRDMYGAFRRRARIVPMGSDNTHLPRHTSGFTAFFAGEGAPAPEGQSAPDGIGLTAKKLLSLVRVSNELGEDAIRDIVDFVANEMGVAFAAKEDDCAFNGDGTSAYGTMRGLGPIVNDGQHGKARVLAATGHNTFALLDTTDITNLMGSVRASALPNAAWFCSVSGFAFTICRLASQGGGFLETRIVDGISTPFYQGFPVVISQKFPLITTTLAGSMMMAFGDMYAGAVLGERRGMTVARSDDRYFEQDQIGLLGSERFHAVIHDLGDNTNFGSLAALVGN